MQEQTIYNLLSNKQSQKIEGFLEEQFWQIMAQKGYEKSQLKLIGEKYYISHFLKDAKLQNGIIKNNGIFSYMKPFISGSFKSDSIEFELLFNMDKEEFELRIQ
ncbi:MAG: hypothetical protein MUF58_21565 [Arcicella sp.]|jgi:hypothetical protein|nr:hypothetical protein [Microscillaceae bacterium]MCU0471176.1 hypothetical protein [Arcicella sp.]